MPGQPTVLAKAIIIMISDIVKIVTNLLLDCVHEPTAQGLINKCSVLHDACGPCML